MASSCSHCHPPTPLYHLPPFLFLLSFLTSHSLLSSASPPPAPAMNTTAGDGGFFGNSNNAGYSYGIGVSVGILILITTITLASYFCTRADTHPPSHGDARGQRQPQPPQSFVIDVGIDEATLHTYPKLLYSKANLAEKDSTATCCSICLADYKRNDVLRLLPDCNHIFHLKCVDPWLRLHPTCPVCRTSPLPTPQSTPLAEVVPLAAAAAAQRS